MSLWPFGSPDDRTESTADEQPDDEAEADPDDDVETVTAVLDTELTFDYTEHEAVARYADGEQRTWVFDSMEKTEHGIVLSDYTNNIKFKPKDLGVTMTPTGPQIRSEPNFPDKPSLHPKQRKFAVITWDHLQDFETVERRDRTKTEDYHREEELDRETAEEFAETYDDISIEEG